MAGIVLGASILLGVVFHDLGAGWYALPLVAAGALVAVVGRPDRRSGLLAIAAAACVLLGFWRASVDRPRSVASLPTDEYRYQGIVIGMPSRTAAGSTARLELRDPAGGSAWVLLPAVPEVRQGDVIACRGLARRDPTRKDPTTLLPSGGSGAPVIRASSCSILGSEASVLEAGRADLEGGLRTRLESNIPEPAGSLAAGVILGDDGDMTASTGDAFRNAGLSHITAVSGWNVALVAGLLAFVTGRARARMPVALALGVVGIWGFAYLVGMGPSVIRAAVMGSLALVAGWRGRPADSLTSLVWASAAMVLLSPSTGHDVGFQLSVAATAAIVVTAPLLAGWPRWTAMAAIPVAAELAVAPLLLHHFGAYSVVAPLANVVAAPLIPAVMFGALVTGLASLVHPILAAAAGIGTWLPARLLVGVAEGAAGVPYLSGRTVPVSWRGVIVAYAVLAAVYGLLWYVRFGGLARRAAAGT